MPLFRMSFQLTNRCNQNCRHCLRDQDREHPRDLPLDLFTRIADQAMTRYNVDYFTFTGGEVLLYPHFREAMEYVAGRGAWFTFISNGVLIPKFAEMLVEPQIRCRLSTVAISMEGGDKDTHDYVRGAGSYKKAMAAVASLKAMGIPVVIRFTVGKHNLEKMEQAFLGFSHLGVERIEVAPMMPTPENIAAGLMPSPDEVKRAMESVLRMMGQLKTPVHPAPGFQVPHTFYACDYLHMENLYVDFRGRLAICCMMPDLRRPGMEDNEPEIAADLATANLWDAHARLIDLISALQKDRLKKLGSGEITDLDKFQCLNCARYFGKTGWIDASPENPWAKPGK